MSPHDDRYLELLPAYAIGALDGEELRQLEAHLESGCPACEEELAAWRGDVEKLAASAPRVEPSETTRARVLGRIAEDRTSEDRVTEEPAGGSLKGGGDMLRLALAATLAGLLVGGWLLLDLRRQVADLAVERQAAAKRLGELESELDSTRAELGSTRSELARLRLVGGIAASPRTRLVALAGLVEPGEAFGQALVDPVGSRAVFYAYGLRPTEEGKTYQLWYISNGTPVSAGIFDVDEQGRAMVVVEEVAPAESIEAWAVTVEPAGGLPQPTGTMVLKG